MEEYFLDRFYELGIRRIDPCQPVNDINAMKAKYPDMCFLGGLDIQGVIDMPGKTEEEWKAFYSKIKEETELGSYNISVEPIEARKTDGTKVTFIGDNATVEVIDCVIGDVDGDGEVSDWDAILLNRHLAGWNVTLELSAADVDGDGEVSDWDAITLDRYLAGWDVMLGK